MRESDAPLDRVGYPGQGVWHGMFVGVGKWPIIGAGDGLGLLCSLDQKYWKWVNGGGGIYNGRTCATS